MNITDFRIPLLAAALIGAGVFLVLDARGIFRQRRVRWAIGASLLIIIIWIFRDLMGAMSV